MGKLFYIPLESYVERYTGQMSCVNGWVETFLKMNKVDFVRVEGIHGSPIIKKGVVLDATGRGIRSCSQIMKLLEMTELEEITSDDSIYFDDFWHPGISALPYAFDQVGIHPKMYAFLWAQSVDQFDFTYPMRSWMRHFEIGEGKFLAGIFVASTILKDMCLYAGIGTNDTVHVVGLPYSSVEVKKQIQELQVERDHNQVIFTSRWDKEKRPEFFLSAADLLLSRDVPIKFVVTTSSPTLRSNDPKLLSLLRSMINKYPQNIILKEGLTKKEYYAELLRSKVQFNCADQDFVSFTLLEAATCGCAPVYPYYLSFPESLNFNTHQLYAKNDLVDAVNHITSNLYDPIRDWSWVYERHDRSFSRLLNIIKGETHDPVYSSKNTI
jgi:glycosyltransferase involved in cell wall biosynthesis